MKHKIVIIGGGGHARVIINIIKKNGHFEIAGYTDKVDYGEIYGVKYLGVDKELEIIKDKKDIKFAVIGLGYVRIDDYRENLIKWLLNIGFTFPKIISKNSLVNEGVSIGEGTIICDSVNINIGVKIGKFSIINTGAIIEHDCKIGDFAHVSSGSVIAGNVSIGNSSIIGAGATIIQNINVTEKCFIGAGALVAKNCLNSGKYIGIPARFVQNC